MLTISYLSRLAVRATRRKRTRTRDGDYTFYTTRTQYLTKRNRSTFYQLIRLQILILGGNFVVLLVRFTNTIIFKGGIVRLLYREFKSAIFAWAIYFALTLVVRLYGLVSRHTLYSYTDVDKLLIHHCNHELNL